MFKSFLTNKIVFPFLEIVFEKNKIEYNEKNVQKHPELAAELLEKSGQMGVPVITIDDKLIIGFNKNRLKRTLKI